MLLIMLVEECDIYVSVSKDVDATSKGHMGKTQIVVKNKIQKIYDNTTYVWYTILPTTPIYQYIDIVASFPPQ